MVRLVLGIIAVPVLVSYYYNWFAKGKRPDRKTILLLLVATITVVQVFYERLFPGSSD